jgi:hypothetical protein
VQVIRYYIYCNNGIALPCGGLKFLLYAVVTGTEGKR